MHKMCLQIEKILVYTTFNHYFNLQLQYNSKISVKMCVLSTTLMRIRLDTIYFAETENWKHCSKIIFKYVNIAVGPIFNESFVEKRGLWVPWTVHETCWNSVDPLLKKIKKNKKKKKKKKTQMHAVNAVSKQILNFTKQN